MTSAQIERVCAEYDNFLLEMGITEAARENDKPGSLPHLRWMVQEIPLFLESGIESHIEKAHRWLGFVQGVLWNKGIFDIEKLKNDNR
jgi:hypothetical protein